MKGLILAGGKGAALRPSPLSMPKALVPIANRPVVSYLVDLLEEAGVSEVGVVVDNREGSLAAWPGWRRRPGMKFFFLEQSLPLGTAHAVKVAQGFVGNEPFLVVAGDCFYDGSLLPLTRAHGESDAVVSALTARTARPGDFGVVETNGNHIVRVVEKPQRSAGDVVLAGAFVLNPDVFSAIDVVKPSSRGDLELTAVIRLLIERGRAVRGVPFDGFWRDMGRPEDILEANTHWLDSLSTLVKGNLTRSAVKGRVAVNERARIVNSSIQGPAVIGMGSYIANSWIGPYTAIGNHTVVEECEVERSVVMDRCRLRGVGRMEGSVVGEGNRLLRRSERPLALRLVIGEGNVIEVP